MTVKIIACEVMKEELLSIEPQVPTEYEFISMGLHSRPKKLQQELQKILNSSSGYSKLIVAFGLCGGALRGLKAPDCPIIIPRVHDCIPILLGSKERYNKYQREEKGTFYLSCGWMITEKNILSEHQRVCAKYGEKKAKSILDRMYDSYKKVLFIHTSCQDESQSLQNSREIAGLLNLSHNTVKGDKEYIDKIVGGPWDEDGFIFIFPFGTVEEELFR